MIAHELVTLLNRGRSVQREIVCVTKSKSPNISMISNFERSLEYNSGWESIKKKHLILHQSKDAGYPPSSYQNSKQNKQIKNALPSFTKTKKEVKD